MKELKGWRWASMSERAMVVGEGGGAVMVGGVEAGVGAEEAGEVSLVVSGCSCLRSMVTMTSWCVYKVSFR